MLRVNSSNNAKYLKVYCRKVKSTTEWQTFVNVWEISYSNLETMRYGPNSVVWRIIRESWQDCTGVLGRNTKHKTRTETMTDLKSGCNKTAATLWS